MSAALRPGLPELPDTMRGLAVDERGYPVPFFVALIDGKPDHRVVDPAKLWRCVRKHLCWICGQRLTKPAVSVVGPMCGINRVSSEPPMHEACARFSVQACPFLSKPQMHRREAGMPEGLVEASGNMLLHNPGVSLLWWTERVEMFKVPPRPGQSGVLFDIGKPLKVEWWTQGRQATRQEVERAVAAGLPKLTAAAESAAELLDIQKRLEQLHELMPAEVSA